jgi:hypothetical protein
MLKAYLLGLDAVAGILWISPGIPVPVVGIPGVPFPVPGVPSSSVWGSTLFFQPFGFREVPHMGFLLSYEGFFFMVVVVV